MQRLLLTSLFSVLCLACTLLQAQVHQPVRWHVSSVSVNEKESQLIFTANLDDGWHIYSQHIEEGGPLPTTFTFQPSADYVRVGTVKEESTPVKSYDQTFMMDIVWYGKTAVFTQKVTLNVPETTIKGKVEFMVCTDEMCLPPDEVDFAVDVKKGPAGDNKEEKKTSPREKGQRQTGLKEASFKTEQVPGDGNLGRTRSPKAAPDDPSTVGSQGGYTKKASLAAPLAEADTVAAAAVESPEKNTPKAEIKSNVSQQHRGVVEERSSLWGMLVAGFLGGLAAMLMPCIFPMLPFTVGYFMKQGGSRRNGVGMALVYGLSIVVIYVSLGLVVTLVFGSDALNDLSTNGIFNFAFFLMLILFAASFLGAFELTLPSSWITKVDHLADQKGLPGIFFMAATLALVSFSCTGPIIGTLLVETAVKDGLLFPVTGMLGFSLALALPFTLFAIFPSWLSALPKSGGWLNNVKVVLGFLELALALKFLSNVDLAYHWEWFDREVFLAMWIIIFGLLGFYLLGKIRLPEDAEVKQLSPLRMFLAVIALAFTLYMVPGLWGAPLKAIAAFLPPQQTQDFDLYTATLQKDKAEVTAPDVTPKKYDDIFEAPYGLDAFFDFEEGMDYARRMNKPVLIDFTGHACVNCRKMEATVWPDPKVLRRLREDYVLIQLYVDDKTALAPEEQRVSAFSGKPIRTIGNKWSDLQASLFNTNSQPYYVLLNHDSKPLVPASGAVYDAEYFSAFLDQGINRFKLIQ